MGSLLATIERHSFSLKGEMKGRPLPTQAV